MPNASDVDRVERDLLARSGCLFSGTIGTFDDLFTRLIRNDPGQRPVATDAQRALVVRRALGATSLNGLTRSARTSGFAEALLSTLAELEQGMLDPEDLAGDLAKLYAAYRSELDRLRPGSISAPPAAERRRSDLDAHGEPFLRLRPGPDRRGWSLLGALAGRRSRPLPYEPGQVRVRLAHPHGGGSLRARRRTRRARPSSASTHAPCACAPRRALFQESPPPPRTRRRDGFSGARNAAAGRLVGDELGGLIQWCSPERIFRRPSVESWRAPLETVLGCLEIYYAVERACRQPARSATLLHFLRYA